MYGKLAAAGLGLIAWVVPFIVTELPPYVTYSLFGLGLGLLFYGLGGAVLQQLGRPPKEQPKASATEKLIPIRDACAWIVEHTSERLERFQGGHRMDAALRIRQAASEGKIIIRGRQKQPDDSFALVWSDIPTEYWQTHQFDWLAILDESVVAKTETEPEDVWNSPAKMLPLYAQLRVSEHRVRELWPAKD